MLITCHTPDLTISPEESEARQAESVELLRQKVEECTRRLDVISQSTVGNILFSKKFSERKK